MATCDAWSIGIFAALSLPLSLIFFDIPSILISVGMVVVTVIEYRAANELRKLDVFAPRRLGFNQVAFATILCLYALWNLGAAFFGPPPNLGVSKDQMAQLSQVMGNMNDLARWLSMMVYGGIILIAIAAQGGLALYYFTRTKYVRDYVAHVSPWIIQLQQAGVRV